jgi:hypothetical protein
MKRMSTFCVLDDKILRSLIDNNWGENFTFWRINEIETPIFEIMHRYNRFVCLFNHLFNLFTTENANYLCFHRRYRWDDFCIFRQNIVNSDNNVWEMMKDNYRYQNQLYVISQDISMVSIRSSFTKSENSQYHKIFFIHRSNFCLRGDEILWDLKFHNLTNQNFRFASWISCDVEDFLDVNQFQSIETMALISIAAFRKILELIQCYMTTGNEFTIPTSHHATISIYVNKPVDKQVQRLASSNDLQSRGKLHWWHDMTWYNMIWYEIPSPNSNSESSLFQHSIPEYKPVYEIHVGLLVAPINNWVTIFHRFIACYSRFHSRTFEPWNHVRGAGTDREIFWVGRLRCPHNFNGTLRTMSPVLSLNLSLIAKRDLALWRSYVIAFRTWSLESSRMKHRITSNKQVEDGDSIIDRWGKETHMTFVNWFIFHEIECWNNELS